MSPTPGSIGPEAFCRVYKGGAEFLCGLCRGSGDFRESQLSVQILVSVRAQPTIAVSIVLCWEGSELHSCPPWSPLVWTGH